MANGYEIHKSKKFGIRTKESYIVTRQRTSFLRILGEHPSYLVMTATASEDSGDFLVCKDKARLTSAALQFGAELGTQPSFDKDIAGREFIHICTLNFKPGGTAENDDATLDRAFRSFFEIYDASNPTSPEQLHEMREFYLTIVPDDSGDDVYLSDGVWLGSDGTLHDRSR